MKRRRKPRTFDPSGQELSGGASGDWTGGTFTGPVWSQSDTEGLLWAEVPNDTPLTSDVIMQRVDFPVAGITTWYAATAAAAASGRVQAALDTLSATGAQLATAGSQVLNVAGTIAQNFLPILLGLAAIWFLSQRKGNDHA